MPIKANVNMPERTLELVQREILETTATVAALRKALHAAMSSVRSKGVEVWKLASDNHGQTRKVKRPNPALKRQRECEAGMRSLNRYLETLRAEEKEFQRAVVAVEEDPSNEFAVR